MKVLYISHIDWDWIKQRPQFLAEEMAEDCHMTYVYKKVIGQKFSGKNARSPKMQYKVIYLLPLTRFRLIQKINAWIYRIATGWLAYREKVDLIWTADCRCTSVLNKKKKVIYEAMDLYGELAVNSKEQEEILENEKIMVQGADCIVVTSNYIRKKLQEMYCIKDEKIALIRNGFSVHQDKINQANYDAKNLRIAYVGTVAAWFDWGKIKYSLNMIDKIEYHIIGPIVDKPNVELPEGRVKFYGAVQHDKLPKIIENIDVLIMPFQVNEVVKAVDPVKIYEYISFARDIICVRYEEVERFAEYVYFYNSAEEYVDSIRQIIARKNIKYTLEQAEAFLAKNNWGSRAQEALVLCSDVLGKEKVKV